MERLSIGAGAGRHRRHRLPIGRDRELQRVPHLSVDLYDTLERVIIDLRVGLSDRGVRDSLYGDILAVKRRVASGAIPRPIAIVDVNRQPEAVAATLDGKGLILRSGARVSLGSFGVQLPGAKKGSRQLVRGRERHG